MQRSISILLFSAFALLSGCSHVFFQPSKDLLITPDQLGLDYRDVYFSSNDNLQLHGWWFPAAEKSNALILFLHGNAENISTHSAAVYWLTRHQYDVFIFDYRGYGLSQGQPQLDGAINDIYHAMDYARNHYPADKKIFLIGQSLGASLGIYSLSRRPQGIDGAVFVSPFSDYREIARDMLASSWLTWGLQWPLSLTISNRYRPLDAVDQLPQIPLLYLYSEQDEIIHPRHVLALYQQSKSPKFIARLEGNHSNLFGHAANRQLLLQYLDSWLSE